MLQIKSGASNTQVVETTLAASKKLARKHKSLKLAQLASKISTVIAYGGNDVFKQVKEMILKDIEALKKEAQEDATEKAYCDEELAKTEAKKVELDADVEKLVAKIDQATSQSAQLKEEVAEAQESLVAITKGQADRIPYAKSRTPITNRQRLILKQVLQVSRRRLLSSVTTMVVPRQQP